MKNRLLLAYTSLILLFLYFPIGILILFSFNADKFSSSWTRFTVDWYFRLIENEALLGSLKTSLVIAIISAAISTLLGTFTAYALHKFMFKAKSFYQGFLSLPILVPDLVMGIGLTIFFALTRFTMGLSSVILAHITFNLAYTHLIIATRFSHMENNLENAAVDLGATPLKAFIYVTIPVIYPGIISAFLLAFTLSWDDFVISFFTSGIGTTTLPVKVYSMIKMGVDPQINALSTLIIAISFILILIVLRIERISNVIKLKNK